MCFGILSFVPYMKCVDISSLYLLAGTVKPTASAACLINIGFAPQQTTSSVRPEADVGERLTSIVETSRPGLRTTSITLGSGPAHAAAATTAHPPSPHLGSASGRPTRRWGRPCHAARPSRARARRRSGARPASSPTR